MFIPHLSEIRPHEKLLWDHFELFSSAAPYKLPNGQIVCGVQVTQDLETTRWGAKVFIKDPSGEMAKRQGDGALTREDAIKWAEDTLGDHVPTEEWKAHYVETANTLRDRIIAQAKERGRL